VPRSYARVAWCYDELAAVWSLGAIPRAKALASGALAPGERVLFAGAGRGSDALAAAGRGVRVSALDAEPAMLRRLSREERRRPTLAGASVRCLREDWFLHAPDAPYDAVVASFVLNVFAGRELARAMDRLRGWVRPGGRLLIADFAPIGGGWPSRLLGQLHYWPVALIGRGLGLCRLHSVHDYVPLLEERGFDVKEQRDVGPYRVWSAYLSEVVREAAQPVLAGRQ